MNEYTPEGFLSVVPDYAPLETAEPKPVEEYTARENRKYAQRLLAGKSGLSATDKIDNLLRAQDAISRAIVQYQTENLKASLGLGLEQSAAGDVESLGSFEQYADVAGAEADSEAEAEAAESNDN